MYCATCDRPQPSYFGWSISLLGLSCTTKRTKGGQLELTCRDIWARVTFDQFTTHLAAVVVAAGGLSVTLTEQAFRRLAKRIVVEGLTGVRRCPG